MLVSIFKVLECGLDDKHQLFTSFLLIVINSNRVICELEKVTY